MSKLTEGNGSSGSITANMFCVANVQQFALCPLYRLKSTTTIMNELMAYPTFQMIVMQNLQKMGQCRRIVYKFSAPEQTNSSNVNSDTKKML